MRVLLVLLFLTGVARADDSIRCGGDLVPVGATQQTVIDHCGVPTRATRNELRGGGYRGHRIHIIEERWFYERAQEFVRTLVFHDGVLKEIYVGDYPP